MREELLHDWKVTPAEGRLLQERLAHLVKIKPLAPTIKLVAGADMAFSREWNRFFAAVVVLALPELEVLEEVSANLRPTFPYVPGLLSFREGPVLLKAFAKLRHDPDAVIFDGQGVAHPRRLGLASHLGLWLGIPSVGCAKSRLIGEHAAVGEARGDSVPLLDKDEQIGVVLRPQNRVRPLYVSPGHLADLESSTRLVATCCRRCRLPEPTRLADIAVARVKREYIQTRPARGPQGSTPVLRLR